MFFTTVFNSRLSAKLGGVEAADNSQNRKKLTLKYVQINLFKMKNYKFTIT